MDNLRPTTPYQCSLCGSDIDKGPGDWDLGHNAEPLEVDVPKDLQTAYLMPGRCCSTCNDSKVIPERMRRAVIEYKEAQMWAMTSPDSNHGLNEAIVKLEKADAEYEAKIKRLEEEGHAP